MFEHLISNCGLASEWDLPGGDESLGWAYFSLTSCLSSASDCGHEVTNHLNAPATMPSAPWWTVSPQTVIPQIPSSLRCQVPDHSTKTSSQDAGPSFPGLVEYSWRLLSDWWDIFSLGKWIFALFSFIVLGFLGWPDVPVAEGGMQIKAISTLVTLLSIWKNMARVSSMIRVSPVFLTPREQAPRSAGHGQGFRSSLLGGCSLVCFPP